ncbi:biotin--protein ligase-like [Patiria miniata]|uniref:BPL/LPL catalytic domain-containing protein n=1 Tax=Patiria miniata TaxID=46514 RepID=A0A914A7J4_PATMI|nr:biotin--protein ligase-like [Patiria miniata]
MLFTVCYAYLTFSTAWRDYRQKAKVMNALRCHGSKASIAFRKILQEGVVSEGDKTRASFLCEIGEQPVISQLLGEKRGKQMLVVHPKQRVDLSKDWTSFIGTSTPSLSPYKDPDQAASSSSNPDSVFVLLEASPPKTDRQGRLNLRKVARERVVKLSGLTTPLAWKSGEPFGILVQASANNFGLVGSAYLEGVLELDDGLLVEQIVCVDTIGEPFNLVNQDPKTPSPSPFPPGSPFHRSPSGNSLLQRSGSSKKEVKPLRRKHSQEFLKKLEEQHQRISRKSSSESSDLGGISVEMAGQGLDDEVLVDIEGSPKFHLGGATIDVGGTSSGDASNVSRKPPNLLVYTGSDDTDKSRYKSSVAFLEKFLHRDRYVIYHLEQEQALKHPWAENCKLLLLMTGKEPIPENTLKKFTDYVKSGGFLFVLDGQSANSETPASVSAIKYSEMLGGEMLSFQGLCSEDPLKRDLFPGGQMKVLAESQGNAVITETSFKGSAGKIISSQVQLQLISPESLVPDTEAFTELKQSNEVRHQVIFDLLGRLGLKCATSELPDLTAGYLLGVNEQVASAFLTSIQPNLKDSQLASRYLTMQFNSDPDKVGQATPDLLPVITGQSSPRGGAFDFEVYKKHLTSKRLGNVVLYTEVVPTTMVLFESLMFKVPGDVGVVAIATRMTAGKGRGGNKWLGPIGCAMFSLHVRIPFGSELADKLPFLQHIASAAVVEAVRSINGYQDIDLRLKWPNDIYYGDKMKLGGVIVNSSALDNVFHAIIGCGFNVDNSDPTICINDLIRLHNKQTNANLALLTIEELIARTISQIESIIQVFQNKGAEPFLEMYYRRWLHSGCKVRLENESGPEVTVEGLDRSGFLSVRDQQGALRSVQPDGNTFDMTKNLVLMKERRE